MREVYDRYRPVLCFTSLGEALHLSYVAVSGRSHNPVRTNEGRENQAFHTLPLSPPFQIYK